MTMVDDIATMRAFNRFYTRIIGLLEEGMHNSPYALSEARVVHEIGKRNATTASELCEALAMDRGQMSRLVWRLSDLGLLASLPGADKRSNNLALTPQGDTIYRDLNAASDADAENLLTPLDPLSRLDLVAAMRRIEAILAGPVPGGTLTLRPPCIGEIGQLIARQGLLYHLEQGWNHEFELLITRIYAEFDAAPDPATKGLWIADYAGELAGSIFVLPAPDEDRTAQLRMLYVEPAFRGLGIGKTLVAEVVRFSRAAGYRRVILWTQDCLASARRIYQATGFELVEEEKHHSFGADLNGQYWALNLQ
ncbi:MAG: MarR family transcriptional regulator [Devosia sp.]|uniref:bifunctional helix-turn-helix transcriptional regulator/GNAT family N-acetyltransferase n=1 Tax=Devosia sp. TaxID=1871048 RepID=UPI002629194F|nr:helix-turn-helix domain-containing GNAT family N-acetyltransferase [Devosia sp.]MDB5528293.1 MarR family transcriptional regulator [Devosia sp.]